MKASLPKLRFTRAHAVRMVLSLLLAVVVWIYVTMSQNPEQLSSFDNVPVEVQGLPAGLVLTDAEGIPLSALPPVSLLVHAPESVHPSRSDFQIYVDMSGVSGPGSYTLPVNVGAPPSVRTTAVSTNQVKVWVEREEQRLFPIQVKLLGKPGLPYQVGDPTIDPSQVVVQGPESRVALVDTIQARLDLGGRVASLANAPVTLAAVDTSDSIVEGVTLTPSRATLNVGVTLLGGHKAISVVPVTSGQPAPGYYVSSIEVAPDTVTIYSSDPGALAQIRYMETQPISITGLNQDMSSTVALNLPSNVTLIGSPENVSVTVRFGEIHPELQLQVPVRLVGQGEGLDAAWGPAWLGVIIRGPIELLQGLSLNDLWASVDVTGMDAGEYDLTATFPAPPGIQVFAAGDGVIHVSLTHPATPTPTPTPGPEPSPRRPSPTKTAPPPAVPTPEPTPSPTPTKEPAASPTPTSKP